MADSPRGRRRRVQWRLRTFFRGVALCALVVWLALHIGWMRRRHAALVWMRNHPHDASYATWAPSRDGATYSLEWDHKLGGPSLLNVVGHGLETAAPWSLRLLGEPGVSVVTLRGDREQLSVWRDRFARLFPEAHLQLIETPDPRHTLPPGRVVRSSAGDALLALR